MFSDQIKQSYKKLKSSVYFDKTQAILRNRIVAYECSGRFDKFSDRIVSLLTLKSDSKWNNYKATLVNSKC